MATPVPELVEEVADRIVILHEGRVIADGNMSELQQQTQCTGSLADVLEQLIFPQTLANVEQYFQVDTE